MKTLVYTVIQNDMVMLDLWLKYYSRYFDNLFVIKWMTKKRYDPYFKRLSKKYKIDFDSMGKEDVLRYGANMGARIFIQKKQAEFLALPNEYDWVLYCNCDEILAPRKGKNLRDFMKKNTHRKWVACEGYEVIQAEGEGPIDYSKPYLRQRKYWIKNFNYNKIILSRVYLDWVDGTHKLAKMTDDESRAFKNTGLYLVHLKHADLNPKGKRDFGPFKTNPDPNIMQHWLDKKEPIPEHIRKLI